MTTSVPGQPADDRKRRWQVAIGWADPEERLAACMALAEEEITARYGGLAGEVRLAIGEEEGREERWAEAINVPGLNEAVPLATALAIMSRCIRLADAEVAAAIQAALPRPPLPADWRETLAARQVEDAIDELQALPECWYGGYPWRRYQ